MTVAGIDLSDTEFWGLPLAERAAAFAQLRAQGRPQFYAEPEVPFTEKGPGYYALVRHADVVEASGTRRCSLPRRARQASRICPPSSMSTSDR